MQSELPFSDHGYYGEDEEEDDNEKEGEEESDDDDAFLSIFNQRTEWTDWGTLQHETALGCQVHWQEWLVAFSPVWESPFLVFDCGRADKFVEGVLGVEELWDGVVGWKSCEEEDDGRDFLDLCRGGDELDLDQGQRSRDDEFHGTWR
ncbi:hypothetical protein SLS58_000573 [Diplodia intermedia]|uniref:Uncharacterized protein n=1 Tax=Diplodia intermedia TaxID=856260 RepID=A0ABR3U5C8_9PEZI